MNSLQAVVGTLPGFIVYFAALILTGARFTVLLIFIREKHGKGRILAAAVHFIIGLFFLAVLLDYSYNVLIQDLPETIHLFEWKLFGLPWLLYAGLEIVSAAVICLNIRYLRRYRDTHLTVDSIRQVVDLLPTGLLFSEADGTVLLANLTMTELYRSLTGELLSDAGRFRQHIEAASGSDNLIRTKDGRIWQFSESRVTLDDREYDEMAAVDMTEQYRITDELSAKNSRLKEVQAQMKAVSARESSLVAAREIMNARRTVHDRIGAVLLSGKYYLDHPENVKEEELLRLLEYGSYFLIGEAEQPEEETDLLQETIRMTRRIGVSVQVDGRMPENKGIRDLLAQAVSQCAANTVRHAGGNRLFIRLTEDEGNVTAVFSNNGKAPEGPIAETGGLAVLRKAVEAAEGTMRIESAPIFLLTVTIPKNA